MPSIMTRQQPQAPSGAQPFFGRDDAALLAQHLEEVHPRLVGGCRCAFPFRVKRNRWASRDSSSVRS